MLNQTGVTIKSGVTPSDILVDDKNSTAISCRVGNDGITEVDEDGNKVIYAGTPLAGNLAAIGSTKFTAVLADANAATAVGVVRHDIVFKGAATEANDAIVIVGVIDENQLDSTVQTILTDTMKKAIPSIKFIKM
jgi:hypothetical protein